MKTSKIDKIEKEVLEEIERNNELLLGAFTPEEKCIINAILHECIKLTTKKTAQELLADIGMNGFYTIDEDNKPIVIFDEKTIKQLKQKWGGIK